MSGNLQTYYNDTRTKTLLLACIDYRFVDLVSNYMSNRGLAGKYYLLTLPGASLTAVDSFREDLISILGLLKNSLNKVIILDHDDCLAYNSYLEDLTRQPDTYSPQIPRDEDTLRRYNMDELYKLVRENSTITDIETLIIHLDGQVEAI